MALASPHDADTHIEAQEFKPGRSRVTSCSGPLENFGQATSLEMAGASLSLLRLDEELKALVDAPAESPFFVQR